MRFGRIQHMLISQTSVFVGEIVGAKDGIYPSALSSERFCWHMVNWYFSAAGEKECCRWKPVGTSDGFIFCNICAFEHPVENRYNFIF